MDRRNFLKNSLLATAMYSGAGLPGIASLAQASAFAPVMQRTLVNIKLDGGPDFRHLFAPAYNAAPGSFGRKFWGAMSTAHGIAGNASAWEQRWNNDYTPLHDGSFGVLSSCGWLQRMWTQGNVALISNVLGSDSRNHAHASLVLEQGNRSSGPSSSRRSGWGGRLADAAGGNVIAVTRTPGTFCFGPHPADPEDSTSDVVIPAQDIRDMKFYRPDPGTNDQAANAVMTRGVSSYYAAKRHDMAANSRYRRFLELESRIREFGEPIEARTASLPIPADIAALYDGATPRLESGYFGLQIRNLYDAFALNDIFAMRVASLEYLGFDTHDQQRAEIETRFNDLFGDNMGLESLWRNLPTDARNNTVFALAGEFGRQIRANGDAGTDHGEGFYVLLIGKPVNGGVYGDMFPDEELARLADPSPEIRGQTAIDHAFGRICDWMQPGAGDVVFPERAGAPIEPGLNLSGLLG